MNCVDFADEGTLSLVSTPPPKPVTAQHPWRGRTKYLKPTKRTLAPAPLTGRDTLIERVARSLLPWTIHTYPGVRRGLVELLGRRVTYSAIKGWRSGRRPLPAWAALLMAKSIRIRCSAANELAAELELWAQNRERIETERREAMRTHLNPHQFRGLMARNMGEK